MSRASLTVCIIGRNQRHLLAELFESLHPLEASISQVEVVYVDSGSSDGSAELARTHCDALVVLPEHEGLCAARGRYWATLGARGDWLLYLDGDMRLCPEFIDPLRDCLRGDHPDGLVGAYTDVYPDGSTRPNALGKRLRPGPASHFGGAVLLRRAAVLAAGNWDPDIFAYEEMDLYARLRQNGARIEYVDAPMVEHRTPYVSKLERLADCIYPSPGRIGKKFYGFGQLLAARATDGALSNLMRFFPEPFVLWGTVLVSSWLQLAAGPAAQLAVMGGAMLWVGRKRGMALVLVYLLLPVQAVSGWWHFRRYRVSPLVSRLREIDSRSGEQSGVRIGGRQPVQQEDVLRK